MVEKGAQQNHFHHDLNTRRCAHVSVYQSTPVSSQNRFASTHFHSRQLTYTYTAFYYLVEEDTALHSNYCFLRHFDNTDLTRNKAVLQPTSFPGSLSTSATRNSFGCASVDPKRTLPAGLLSINSLSLLRKSERDSQGTQKD